MSRVFLKLRLILWKNLIIRKRHWLLTLFEVIIPVLLCVAILTLTSLIPKPYIPETTVYPTKDVNQYDGIVQLYYAPNTSIVNQFMDNVDQNLQPKDFLGFATEDEMIQFISDFVQNSTDNFIYKRQVVGVVFDNFPEREKERNLKYRLRTYMNTDQYKKLFPDLVLDAMSDHSEYYDTFPFVKLQHIIDTEFIKLFSEENTKMPQINMTIQKMPYPPHRNNMYTTIIKQIIPSLAMIGFITLFMNVLKRIIEEKSTGIKELMKMMGLQSWMCWFGWFFYSMFVNVISVTIITILFVVGISEKYPGIFVKGNPFIIWIFLFLYLFTMICFIFLISNFFKKPTQGTSIGIFIWIILGVVGNQFVSDDPTSSEFLRNLFSLVPNIGLTLGFNAIIEFEKRNGITFENMWEVPNKYLPHPPMGCVLMTFILTSLFMLFLNWYIENIYPGEFGVGRPWYFPFTKSYWISNKVSNDNFFIEPLNNKPEIENIANNMKSGIQLRNLYKKFNDRYVVNSLSFDIYQNQITVLLGHNGAGKTTTMNMITGLTAPTRGQIIVNGFDIYKNLDNIRKSLGLCPQFNVQFTDLTVIEHLMFFAMLKGSDMNQAKEESRRLLNMLHLSTKENVMAGELSGGMRRKLSLAMAVVGNSETLILDEPTSGLDPEARREIWDFLLNMRGERTILITTHYMEEADILGDRIAIMHNGALQCYGSSIFLKKHYGTGYILSVLVESDWDIEKITDLIKTHIPSVRTKAKSGNCVTYSLPTSDTTALSNLFIDLERQKSELNFINFGVSITTMEEVFLKVGEIADETDKGSSRNDDENKHLLSESYSNGLSEANIETPLFLLKQQLKGLLFKRFWYTTRKWLTFIMAILIPLGMIILAFTLIKVQSSTKSDKNLDMRFDLKLGKYSRSKVFYSTDNSQESLKLSEFYSNLVKEQKSAVVKVDNVTEAIINVGKSNMDDYERSLIVAAEMNYTNNILNLNALYGSIAVHGIPISINLLSNSILQSMNSSFHIDVTNNPIPFKKDVLAVKMLSSLQKAVYWMFLIPLAFTFMFGLLIIFPQEERVTGVLHLQYMAGVSKFLYWISNFVVDFGIYFAMVIITVILLLSFDNGGSFGNVDSVGAFIVLLIAYGLAMLPMAYILTFRKHAASNLSLMITSQVCIGGIIAIILIALISTSSDDTTYQILMYVFYIFPQFAFSYGIFVFTKHSIDIYNWKITTDPDAKSQFCIFELNPCCDPMFGGKGENSTECYEYLSYFGGDYNSSIRNQVLFLIAHFIVYSCALLLCESGKPLKMLLKIKEKILKLNVIDEVLSEEVQTEKERIETQLRNKLINDVLIAQNLKKWYGKVSRPGQKSNSIYAARGLNFGVKSGECFGLLGVNGAGKTTTFKMLTGDIPPSEGESYIHGLSILEHKSKYLKNIGYCPQFDALNFTLTGREMLTVFAYLRGVPDYKVNNEVDKWLYRCGIKQYENRICKKYSGGNKRKLSTAVALIGNPSLIMLDEPTCGVDPVARRKLWDVLSSIRKVGQSIVLTTHSMEECEALCDRLAIMVDGQFRCIGNIQTLKSKYGQGFTVMIKLSSNNQVPQTSINKLKNEMSKMFRCSLKDEHMGMLHYHIDPVNTSIGDIFSFMENLKKKNNFIEDYTVNDTSLEEVFLSFAKARDTMQLIPIPNTGELV